MKILNMIKGKLVAFSMFAIGFLLMLLALAGRSIEKLKREKVSQELADKKASSKQHDKAVEVMLRGVENENTQESDNRKYDFTD